MNHPESFFSYKKNILHYTQYGNGTSVLLAFHGFGQTGGHFYSVASAYPGKYTVYAFDLFFHGKSYWPFKDAPLTKQYWAEIIGAFLNQNQIGQFSLMGFSIGAKFVLSILESFTERVSELILIAPDGIKNNIWYNLATSTGGARQYFRKMVIIPQTFTSIAKAAYQMGFLTKKMLRFAQHQMNSREKRLKLYYTWMISRDLKFDSKHIAYLINTHTLPVSFFLGIHDQIITKKNLQHLLKKINTYQLFFLTCGHSELLEEVARHYSKINKAV